MPTDRRQQRRNPAAWPAVILALVTAGCAGPQSVLDPVTPGNREVNLLWWVMFWGGWAVLGLVVVLALLAVLRAPERRPRLNPGRMVLYGGIALPVVTLTALLVYNVQVGDSIRRNGGDGALRIEVVGKMWWWEVRYLQDGDSPGFTTANEIRVPVGRPVEVSVHTADVIHSFWIPPFGGKIDMLPGQVNTLNFEAERPGVYRGQCAEYCGAQHARMAFYVVAHAPEDFAAWRRRESGAARSPDNPFLQQGFQAFFDHGCNACHALRGTPADGDFGPDLTHVGSRLSLAAGTLPNNQGTLAGWIADAQTLKPGNRMPSFNNLDGQTLRALSAYLESLK